MIDNETLTRLLALADAATPGPWRLGDHVNFDWFVASTSRDPSDRVWAERPVAATPTAAFIAAANPDTIRALVAAVRYATRMAEEYRSGVQDAMQAAERAARRPIDPERLAAAMHHGGVCSAWQPDDPADHERDHRQDAEATLRSYAAEPLR